MNNLIKKAIQAIENGKNEYAVGLLEGVLELTTKEEVVFTSTLTPTRAQMKSIGYEDKVLDKLSPISQLVTGQSPKSLDTKVDSSDIVNALERGTVAKLEAIKALSKQ